MQDKRHGRALRMLAALLLVGGCAQQQVVTTAGSPRAGSTLAAITVDDLKSRLYAYADDSMMGREAGTIGNAMATTYIAAEAARIGLEPAGDVGTWFQDIQSSSARFAGSIAPGTARNVIGIRGAGKCARQAKAINPVCVAYR